MDRVPMPGPLGSYVRATDPSSVIAADLTELTSGNLASAILLTESGEIPSSRNTWTGRTAVGLLIPGFSCANWTNGTDGANGRRGETDAATALWSDSNDKLCDDGSSIYCFGPIPLFSDGFESGGVTAWTNCAGDGCPL